jgi:hypothetical protein
MDSIAGRWATTLFPISPSLTLPRCDRGGDFGLVNPTRKKAEAVVARSDVERDVDES